MKIIHDCAEWQSFTQGQRGSSGFVPTMGALHQGHLELVRRALNENDNAYVSIFVNPAQFNDPKDLAAYPRTLENDCVLLDKLDPQASASARLAVFAPSAEALYPDGYKVRMHEEDWASQFCGAHRPGHFDGVLSVVLKLLNLTKATRAYFGEKDYQQYRLINRMAQAYFLDTEIVPCPIVREADGLAMSSRNVRLNPEGRARAPRIYAGLLLTAKLSAGEAQKKLLGDGFEIEYLEDWFPDGNNKPGRRLVAVWVDGVRLIDNLEINGAPA